MTHIPRKYRKLATVYRHFAKSDHPGRLSFSPEMMAEQMLAENGQAIASPNNGYARGQRLSTITLAMWKQDIQNGMLMKYELYKDPKLASIQWWIRPKIEPLRQGTNALL